MNLNIKKAVIIAPHPDDETLGVGGTIKRLVESDVKVSILIISGAGLSIYSFGNILGNGEILLNLGPLYVETSSSVNESICFSST